MYYAALNSSEQRTIKSFNFFYFIKERYRTLFGHINLNTDVIALQFIKIFNF